MTLSNFGQTPSAPSAFHPHPTRIASRITHTQGTANRRPRNAGHCFKAPSRRLSMDGNTIPGEREGGETPHPLPDVNKAQGVALHPNTLRVHANRHQGEHPSQLSHPIHTTPPQGSGRAGHLNKSNDRGLSQNGILISIHKWYPHFRLSCQSYTLPATRCAAQNVSLQKCALHRQVTSTRISFKKHLDLNLDH